MASLAEELRQRRTQARDAADAILTRAQEDARDLSSEELREFAAQVAQQREVDDRLEELRDQELAELRAAGVRRPRPGRTAPTRAHP